MKKISVIIPVYNVEDYLKACLDSILCQDFDDYEMICVNDASTDGSGDILADYADRYHQMKIIRHTKNKGLSAARNTGIEHAAGKYLWFVDSDDMIAPHAFKELYEKAEAVMADIVYFNVLRIYDGKSPKAAAAQKLYSDYGGIYTGKELFCLFAENKQMKVEAWRQFIRKDFLQKTDIRFYEGILHEDVLFHFLCAMRAERAADINKEFYIYRRRQGSIMDQKNCFRGQSQFVSLVQMAAYWSSHDFTERENLAIQTYFLNLYHNCRYFLQVGERVSKLQAGGFVERFLYGLLKDVRRNQWLTLTQPQLDQLQNAKHVIVYGAGRAAVDILEMLQERNIKIDAAAVSDTAGNPKMLCGVPVGLIDDLSMSDSADVGNTAVVIGVTEKYSAGIKKKLLQLGYREIITALNVQKEVSRS